MTPFERYAANSLELALMRVGFTVYNQPRMSAQPQIRLDLVAIDPSNNRSIGIDIKTFHRKIVPEPTAVKPKFVTFQASKIPVHTVFVSSEPKRIYLDRALAEIIQFKDSYVAVLRDAV